MLSSKLTPIFRIYANDGYKWNINSQMGLKVCFQHKSNIYKSYLQAHGQAEKLDFKFFGQHKRYL